MRGFQLYRPQPSGSFGPITAATLSDYPDAVDVMEFLYGL